MKRRRFLAAGCFCGTGLLSSLVRAQAEWQMPARFERPDPASDEGGLWAMMDRQEVRVRRSPFTLRDARLQEHVQQIACKLAVQHCPDVRVHLMRTPLFNASMAPNGMMQVWTGLMLRAENEAQLAAVLGHEIGHYVARHSVERLRAAKNRSALGQFAAMFGPLGALGGIGITASMFSYGREHEREADSIGATLMHRAGYDVSEAAKVWQNLALEVLARPDGDTARTPLFATHPATEERQQALAALSKKLPGGVTNEEPWRNSTQPFLLEWIDEEVKRGQHAESIALFSRMIINLPPQAAFYYARGEVFRLRAAEGDLEAALLDYTNAASLGREPPATHRGLGMVFKAANKASEARASFQRYIELAPDAADAPMIRSYLEELRS